MHTTPPPPRSADEAARVEAALIDWFERRIPFNAALGLRFESARPGDIRCALPMRGDLVGTAMAGRLHGGVIASVLDTLGGLAMLVGLAEKHAHETAEQVLHRFQRMGTIDLRVDYLRPGVGLRFTALAEITRLGGRIGSAQMRLTNEQGLLLATAVGAYVVS